MSESDRRIRFASCKRSARDLVSGTKALDGHVERFVQAFPRYRGWKLEKAGIAPSIPPDIRGALEARGHIAQSLDDLLKGIVE